MMLSIFRSDDSDVEVDNVDEETTVKGKNVIMFLNNRAIFM